MNRPAPIRGRVSRIFALALVLGALAPLSEAHAQAHLIGPGQEEVVLALFAPHELGGEVAAGFALWSVAIESDHIVVTLRAGDGRETSLTLRHPDTAGGDTQRTTSFAAVPGGVSDAEASAARRTLLGALRRNDHGGFWEDAGETVTHVGRGHEGQGPPPRLRNPILWAASDWVPVDGMAVILLVYLLGLLLAGRLLVRAPRWMVPALGATVFAGALVRLALAPATFLGAWPWSRLYPHVREVAGGSWLAAATDQAGHTFYLTDVASWTNFAYAAAMPLILFSHATYLLRDPRAGLAAAFAVAFLPQHIRFSRCEDGFIASLVLTSLAFALLHGWLRDRSRLVRWLLLSALPLVLYPGYLLRPLNIVFVVVYAGAILALHRETAPRWRRSVALGVVLTVGAAAAVQFIDTNTHTIEVAASHLDWLWNTLRVLASPSLLVLSDPTRTPPVLIVLAVVGGVLAWRAGERRLVGFLYAWLLLFVTLHAFVVQESMQPRYHLHLVVPFLLLAAVAVPYVAKRWPRWLWACGAVLVASPWLHHAFVTDVGYAEMHEYEFVRQARAIVPEGCTVLEYTGSPYDVDELRFSRIGARAGRPHAQRFRAIGVFADGRTGPGHPPLAELLADPPSCLYLYEGLACTTHRSPGETYASHCTALRERLAAETVLEERAPARFYDSHNAGDSSPRSANVPLRLSRAHAASAAPDP